MIVTRSPLRISLGGGGTDLPSYYNRYGGFLIAATINKHIYISLAETFNQFKQIHKTVKELVNE